MRVNQYGDPVIEETIIYGGDFVNEIELGTALILLAEKLGCSFVRTNATKHGTTELELREEEE